MVPCFKMKFMDEGLLLLKNNIFVCDVLIICYVGSTLGERLNSIQVSQDISFNNFILLLLASINDTRAIIINEISYYINAKCKIYIYVPNNLHKWFKVKCYKRRLYVMKRLTVHLSKIGLQYNWIITVLLCFLFRFFCLGYWISNTYNYLLIFNFVNRFILPDCLY